ncbi:hypothetical protein FOMPIDRAFT_91063 [Fomitopsis schrenkii]|uniref:Cytochrome P450 n=1 Tax=Fomitopsis schrenkii TaxID=2126942 RepID=S8FNY4_FOMSC|nr:hypothetical protein FOMPIDRAFT_91063 [Fomitopsis schrenkii]
MARTECVVSPRNRLIPLLTGDLIYTEVLGNRNIIINSHKVAKDLLEKRSGIYSSRPRFVRLVELLGWYPTTSLLPYRTEHHRMQCRWMWSSFGDKRSLKKLEQLRARETYTLLMGLMESPDDLALHVKRYVSALVLESVYGYRITSLEDPYVTMMDEAMEVTNTSAEAGSSLVDVLPALRYVPAWFPGAGFKRAACHGRELVWRAHHVPYRMARERMLSGEAPPSFVSEIVNQTERSGQLAEEEQRICYAAGQIYAAATDTTKTVLMTFILAMVLHPEVFRNAQKEVHSIVGKSRLPTFEDRPSLPYIECILKETYRWNPPLPLGLPHYLTEDDEYLGYHMPKNTAIIPNMWTMSRDETIWDNPSVFRPERFLEMGVADAKAKDPFNVVFGYGRRLCPGRLFADTTLFLVIASIAATLDIRKALDAEGKEITPTASFHPAFISYPHDFVCAISSQSEAAKRLVEEAYKLADTAV